MTMICKKCGKPLIVSDGKCVYCGHPAEGEPGEVKSVKTSWVTEAKTSLTTKAKTWAQVLMKRTVISIIIAIVLGIFVLVYSPWPGCLISINMLILAFALAVLSFQVIKVDKGDESDDEKKSMQVKMNHMLTILLIWGGCFFITGIVCLSLSWWAVLAAELMGVCLLLLAWTSSGEFLE